MRLPNGHKTLCLNGKNQIGGANNGGETKSIKKSKSYEKVLWH